MRKILFKAKAEYGGRGIEAGEWVEGFYCYKQYGYAGEKEYFGGRHKITTGIVEARGAYQERSDEVEYSIIPETVGQYTGLTDKNGKKIFEGDIVRHYCNEEDEAIFDEGYVYWEEKECRWMRTSREKEKHYFIGGHCTYEVIGNIHDNPELLKEGIANE